jgi:hypothetical protein
VTSSEYTKEIRETGVHPFEQFKETLRKLVTVSQAKALQSGGNVPGAKRDVLGVFQDRNEADRRRDSGSEVPQNPFTKLQIYFPLILKDLSHFSSQPPLATLLAIVNFNQARRALPLVRAISV